MWNLSDTQRIGNARRIVSAVSRVLWRAIGSQISRRQHAAVLLQFWTVSHCDLVERARQQIVVICQHQHGRLSFSVVRRFRARSDFFCVRAVSSHLRLMIFDLVDSIRRCHISAMLKRIERSKA